MAWYRRTNGYHCQDVPKHYEPSWSLKTWVLNGALRAFPSIPDTPEKVSVSMGLTAAMCVTIICLHSLVGLEF
jgi:hypothetical protein